MIAAMLPKNDARNIFISILPSVFPLIELRNHAIPQSQPSQFVCPAALQGEFRVIGPIVRYGRIFSKRALEIP
jgi:hypothetical protein